MLGGTKGNGDLFLWAMLGSGRFLVLVFCQCLIDAYWHTDVACAVKIIPFDGHTEKSTRPVDGDFIPLLQCVDDEMGMVNTNIFKAKFINH